MITQKDRISYIIPKHTLILGAGSSLDLFGTLSYKKSLSKKNTEFYQYWKNTGNYLNQSLAKSLKQ